MTQQYTQCKLERRNESKTVWIPTEFAIEGKWIQIKDTDKEKDFIHINEKKIHRVDMWDIGWRVKEIYLTTNEDNVIVKNIKSFGGMLICD